jgi:uncharacterized C2H2 Zn-finger protein
MEKKKPKGLRPNIGDKYKNLRSELCFVNYKDKEIIKLCYICDSSYTEVWDRKEFIEEVKKFHFFLVPKEKITRLNIADHLVEYQLNMVGKTTADARKDDMWYHNWTFTQQQYELFRAYAIPLIKKTFRCNTKKATETFDWFNLQFGLRLKD